MRQSVGRRAAAASLCLALVACGGGADEVPTGDAGDVASLDDAPNVPVDAGGDGPTADIADTTVPPDASAGTFGAPCETASDCFSGWCLPGPEGLVCSKSCLEGCPSGWTCRSVPGASGNPAFVCLNDTALLCLPCLENRDCNQASGDSSNRCIDGGEAGSFCGVACVGDGDCPDGYVCEDAPDAGGTAALPQCVPADGAQCTCSPVAVSLEARTSCAVVNEHGACPGLRECAEDGLTACEGPTPAPETCNAVDDDCDGDTDEDTGGALCEVQTPDGLCPGVEACEDGHVVCLGAEPTAEKCNGLDDDCNGETDEGFPDADGDGLADCVDADDDDDGSPDDADCAPFDPAIHPGATEVCDGRDEDCDGEADPEGSEGCFEFLRDLDDDKLGDDSQPTRCLCGPDQPTSYTTTLGGDCDDTHGGVYAGAPEACNGLDDDCDGETDEGYADLDGDGVADCVESDTDGDGTADALDCAPTDPGVHPGAPETCDGVDEDCDSVTDEEGADGCQEYLRDADGDGFGDPDAPVRCLCGPDPGSFYTSQQGGDCDDLAPTTRPEGEEVCDGVDQDCDGETDEGFADEDGDGSPDCVDEDMDGDGAPDAEDCAPLDGTVHPGADEACDGVDRDCDGLTDEEDSAGCTPWYRDVDGDGAGSDAHPPRCLCGPDEANHWTATEGGDCNDGSALVGPEGEEVCDGVDQDCDGETDEGVQSPCGGCGGVCVLEAGADADEPFAPEAGSGLSVDAAGRLVLDKAPGTATYRHVLTGWPGGGTWWDRLLVSMDGMAKDTATLSVRFRTADTESGLGSAPWEGPFGPFPPAFFPLDLDATGHLLEIELQLTSGDASATPAVERITVLAQEQ